MAISRKARPQRSSDWSSTIERSVMRQGAGVVTGSSRPPRGRAPSGRDLPVPRPGEGLRAVPVATATSKLTSASPTTGVHVPDPRSPGLRGLVCKR